MGGAGGPQGPPAFKSGAEFTSAPRRFDLTKYAPAPIFAGHGPEAGAGPPALLPADLPGLPRGPRAQPLDALPRLLPGRGAALPSRHARAGHRGPARRPPRRGA